jgi:glycosyltransferase involved in cell wall biosynthesis
MIVCLLSMQRIEETYGGIESFTCSLFDWLNKKGIKTLIASRRLSLYKPVRISDSYSRESEKSLEITGWQFPLPIYALGLIVCSLYSSLALIKHFSKTGLDVIHVQDASFSGLAGIIVSKRFNIPLIVHVHGPPIYIMDESFRSPIWQGIDTILTKLAVRQARIIFVTDKKTERFVATFTGNGEKIVRVPTAIDFSSFQTQTSTNSNIANPREVIIGFIGRLHPQKNPLAIIDALDNYNSNIPIKVLIAGAGPLQAIIEKKLQSSKFKDKITLLGTISEKEKKELLAKIDIFLIPSIEEGCPIALLEAMGAGKAIVASNIPSIREVVSNGVDAVLIDPLDIEKLRLTIENLCANQELRHKLGANAKDHSRSFDTNIIYAKILALYKAQILLKNREKS